jgi:hypothetical protein
MQNLLLWLGSIAGSLLVFSTPRIVGRNVRRLQAAKLHQLAFFNAAEVIVEDLETPDEVVALVGWMGDHVNNGDTARYVFRNVLRGRHSRTKNTHDLQRAVAELRPEQRVRLDEAQRHFLMALTFSSPLIGMVWRRTLRLRDERLIVRDMVANDERPQHDPDSGPRLVYAKAA